MDNQYTLEVLQKRLPGFNFDDEQAILKGREFLIRQDKIASLDRGIIEQLKYMVGMENANITEANKKVTLVQSKDVEDIIKKYDGSVIIYFKSADLFRVYDSTQIMTKLMDHINTDFRKYLGPVYEVVPNEAPQKIIMLGDKAALTHIDKIKECIIKFMKGKKIEVTEADIIVMDRGDLLEILINNVSVKNVRERDSIIKELLEFMDIEEKGSDITNNLGKREKAEFAGVQLYMVPSLKNIVGTKTQGDINNLVGYIRKGMQIGDNGRVINIGNLIIANNVNLGNVNNKTVNKTTNNINIVEEESNMSDIDSFVEYICLNKPDWYKEGEFVEKSIIQTNYEDMYGNAPKGFFSVLKNRIYVEDKRGPTKNSKNRVYQVKLFSYDNIK